jgi:hypothetical protein
MKARFKEAGLKTARKIAALGTAAALLMAPATALGAKGGQGKAKGKAKSCAKAKTAGYQLGGTLVSMTADDPATPESSEATVTLTVTSANKHARNAGAVRGETYTVPAGDAYVLKLGDDGALVPAAGDRVKVKGRVAVTKKRCAADGASTADRYATPDIVRVSVSRPETETEAEAPAA